MGSVGPSYPGTRRGSSVIGRPVPSGRPRRQAYAPWRPAGRSFGRTSGRDDSRNAAFSSSRAAPRAGSHEARTATERRATGTAAKVSGSEGATPNRKLRRRLARSSAARVPMATPANAGRRPCPSPAGSSPTARLPERPYTLCRRPVEPPRPAPSTRRLSDTGAQQLLLQSAQRYVHGREARVQTRAHLDLPIHRGPVRLGDHPDQRGQHQRFQLAEVFPASHGGSVVRGEGRAAVSAARHRMNRTKVFGRPSATHQSMPPVVHSCACQRGFTGMRPPFLRDRAPDRCPPPRCSASPAPFFALVRYLPSRSRAATRAMPRRSATSIAAMPRRSRSAGSAPCSRSRFAASSAASSSSGSQNSRV